MTAAFEAERRVVWSSWVAEHAADLANVTGPPMPLENERVVVWVAVVQGCAAIAAGRTPEAAWKAAIAWERDRLTRKGEEDPHAEPPADVDAWVAEQMAAADYRLIRVSADDPEWLRGFLHKDLELAATAPDEPPAPKPLELDRINPKDEGWRTWLELGGAALIRQAAAIVAEECPGVGHDVLYAMMHSEAMFPWEGAGPTAEAAWRAAVYDEASCLLHSPDSIGPDAGALTLDDIVAELRRHLGHCGLVRLAGTADALQAWRRAIGDAR